MDNKSNIYKSKPEFIKEGFDPFSVQYGGFLKGAPLPPEALCWRLHDTRNVYILVTKSGKMLTINGEYVIRNNQPISSHGINFLAIQYAPADWERIECTSTGSLQDVPIIIDYDGETITIDLEYPEDPESSLAMSPDVTDVYQEGEPVPTLIAPEGIAQVFADANCTEYADGEVTEVYVRINGGPYEFGDSIRLGTGENSLAIVTPTNENPDDPYTVICYALLNGPDLVGPIEPGTIVRCHSEFSTDCTNFRKIWYGGE